MSLSETITFITRHPLTQDQRLRALTRFAKWQIRSRIIKQPFRFRWVDDAVLMVTRGMTGATGNIYVGLHEYGEMGFLLHLLRPGDVFVDIGANVGSYTVLASAVCGARTIAFEPVPSTYDRLIRNVNANGIVDRVDARMQAVGADDGAIEFTSNLDSVNHAIKATDSRRETIVVPLVKLSSALAAEQPCMFKVDVEGFETAVFDGGEDVLTGPGVLALVIELNGSGMAYGYNDDALCRRLLDRGFAPVRYDPSRHIITPTVGIPKSGNGIFVRDIDVVTARLTGTPERSIHNVRKIV